MTTNLESEKKSSDLPNQFSNKSETEKMQLIYENNDLLHDQLTSENKVDYVNSIDYSFFFPLLMSDAFLDSLLNQPTI